MVMIPTNLKECFEELDQMIPENDKKLIKAASKEIMINVHHSLGRNIRNEWGLWHGSKLKDYFEEIGVWHADDMSSIILNSYWSRMNNKPFDVDKEVAKFKSYWEDNYPESIPEKFK